MSRCRWGAEVIDRGNRDLLLYRSNSDVGHHLLPLLDKYADATAQTYYIYLCLSHNVSPGPYDESTQLYAEEIYPSLLFYKLIGKDFSEVL